MLMSFLPSLSNILPSGSNIASDSVINFNTKGIEDRIAALNPSQKKILAKHKDLLMGIVAHLRDKKRQPLDIIHFLMGKKGLSSDDLEGLNISEFKDILKSDESCFFGVSYDICDEVEGVLGGTFGGLLKSSRFGFFSEDEQVDKSNEKLNKLVEFLQSLIKSNPSLNYNKKDITDSSRNNNLSGISGSRSNNISRAVVYIDQTIKDSVIQSTKKDEIINSLENTPAQQAKMLLNIVKNLNAEACTVFYPLLNITKIGNVSEATPIIYGDLDGSKARLIVLAMQSGHVAELSEDHCNKLAGILNEEAAVLRSKNDINFYEKLKMFQSNKGLQKNLNEIALNIKFQNSKTPLIGLGDEENDRFSLHKGAGRYIRKQLHEVGCIAVKGNHDSFNEFFNAVLPIDNNEIWKKYENIIKRIGIYKFYQKLEIQRHQFGYYAKHPKNITREEWLAHEKKYYVNAYYDEANQGVFIHNGWEQIAENKVITVWGEIEFTSVQDLVNKINQKTDSDIKNSYTGFRPENKVLPYGLLSGIRLFHGHNSNNNVVSLTRKSRIVNLNTYGVSTQAVQIEPPA